MQSLGVTLVRGINKFKKLKGVVYKHRYHFRKINSSRELKIVMNYIFHNGVKHGTSRELVSHYNSFRAELNYKLFVSNKINVDEELYQLREIMSGRVLALDMISDTFSPWKKLQT
jgi:hypothetical protein